MTVLMCAQKTCEDPAVVRYTWPGRGEMGACSKCTPRVVQVTKAMGMPLEMLPLTVEQWAAFVEHTGTDA